VLLHSPEGFGHIIFDRIARILDRRGLRVQDIECFAAASGPGSFTGVRIGLTVAKGLAEMTGKRVAAVSNLQALAFYGAGDLRPVMLDARRGEVYGAVYDKDLNLYSPEVVMKFPEWVKTLPGAATELISNNPAPFTGLSGNLPIVTAPRAQAGAVGQIAWKQLREGATSDPADVDANYVRRSDAELFWKEPV
jgi:tRNA threonylcarbamoyladenosine biosynthesis protein TsaB